MIWIPQRMAFDPGGSTGALGQLEDAWLKNDGR